VPNEHRLYGRKAALFDVAGKEIDIEGFVADCRKDERRILADDEIGLVIYVGDLNVFTVSGLGDPRTGAPPPHPSGRWLKKVSQISQMRFPAPSVRHQIGSVVVSVSEDSVFVIVEKDRVRKVRGADLKKGMILATGEKVFW
jgi:hypothetical protein